MNFILCGLPGVGKSTQGRYLAKEIGFDFIDTDDLITARFPGMACPEILKQIGEPEFRRVEREVIQKLESVENHVIALGGGSLEDPEIQTFVKKLGHVIYLEADPDQLLRNPDFLTEGRIQNRIQIFESIADEVKKLV